jgi:hypothetical protein
MADMLKWFSGRKNDSVDDAKDKKDKKDKKTLIPKLRKAAAPPEVVPNTMMLRPDSGRSPLPFETSADADADRSTNIAESMTWVAVEEEEEKKEVVKNSEPTN